MERHFTIRVQVHNDHAVLQRILLAFSRRRLRLRAMQMFDLTPGRPAEMQFDLDCRPEQARDVLAQIRAVVEVVQVWAEDVPAQSATVGGAPLVAA